MVEGSDCPTGKEQFANRKAARDGVKKAHARGDHAMSIYRCMQCECYHVGHKRRAVKRKALGGR